MLGKTGYIQEVVEKYAFSCFKSKAHSIYFYLCFAFVSLLTLYEMLEGLNLLVPFSVGQAHY